jgi:hypothetical protein
MGIFEATEAPPAIGAPAEVHHVAAGFSVLSPGTALPGGGQQSVTEDEAPATEARVDEAAASASAAEAAAEAAAAAVAAVEAEEARQEEEEAAMQGEMEAIQKELAGIYQRDLATFFELYCALSQPNFNDDPPDQHASPHATVPATA